MEAELDFAVGEAGAVGGICCSKQGAEGDACSTLSESLLANEGMNNVYEGD